jgi:hypothetical protein
MKQMLETFDLSICNDNFIACVSSHKATILNLYENCSKTTRVNSVHPFIYDFDHLAYRMTLEIENLAVSSGTVISGVIIRLSTDGFHYPPMANLKLHRPKSVTNHKSTHWNLLHKDELLKVPSVVSFVKEFLGLTTADPQCQLVYHEDNQRIDLKFRTAGAVSFPHFVHIQFEPGFPDTYFDDDLWY